MSTDKQQQPTGLTLEIKGKSLIITVADITATHGLSSTGKSLLVGTTHGIVRNNGLEVSVNVFRPNAEVRAAARETAKQEQAEFKAWKAQQLAAANAKQSASVALGSAAIDKALGVKPLNGNAARA